MLILLKSVEDLRKKYFPELEEDDVYWYAIGYFEPTMELLKKNKIDYLIEGPFILKDRDITLK